MLLPLMSHLRCKSEPFPIESGTTADGIPCNRTVLALTVLHYVKREFETIFVHKFSHATMPFRNIFKKWVASVHLSFLSPHTHITLPSSCSHYWLLCGVMTAASFFRPKFGAAALRGTIFDNPAWIGFWSLLWVVSTLRERRESYTRALTHFISLGPAFPFSMRSSPILSLISTFDQFARLRVNLENFPKVTDSIRSPVPTTGSSLSVGLL